MLSDEDLEAAEEIVIPRNIPLPLGESAATLGSGIVGRDSVSASSSGAASLQTQAGGYGIDDLGGYLAYVEEAGGVYSIRIADLDDASSAEGDRVVYRGRRPIESVAVNRAGTRVAFIARSGVGGGDNDVFLLDTVEGRVHRTRTPQVNETHISMALNGISVAWQGGTEEEPSLVWHHVFAGGIELGPTEFQLLFGIPIYATQPSLSGDGVSVAFFETSGNLAMAVGRPANGALAVMDLGLQDYELVSLNIGVVYLAPELLWPSVSYDGSKVMFLEPFATAGQVVPFLSVIDRTAGTFTDVLVGVFTEHPYLTADGEHAAFSYNGNAYAGSITGTLRALSPEAGTTDSATYWARGNFTSYSGTNTQGTFVRPGNEELGEAARTVGYHAFQFSPISTDYYAVESEQDYDGYLLLYQGSFDPSAPYENLLVYNDDWRGSWNGTVGTSRVVAELQKGMQYVVVTTACGAPGSPCGPSVGSFQNLIVDGATPPPPPTVLPEPDDSRFNITLRFWNDSLTEAEKVVFQVAADRWSEVITGDLENIEDFELTESDVTSGAPGIIGTLDDVIIDAAKVSIDGPGGTLARAGAYYVRQGGPNDFLPIYGIMEFDEAEFGPGGFFADLDAFAAVIMHEMGHVLGISRSFWIPLGYISGNPPNTSVCSDVANPVYNDPRYQGPKGNLEWTVTYGADSDTVPIANTGGCGTADSHWREIYLQDELMTGYAQGGGEPLSRVTIGALEDLGYEVDYGAADDWSIPALPTLAQVSPNPKQYRVEFDFASPFTNSRLGEATGLVIPVDLQLGLGNTSTSGCEPEDFEGFVPGSIALVQRGECAFGIKAQNALDAGAVAVLIGNQGDTEARKAPATGTFGDEEIPIIGVPISYDVMVELAETPDAVVAIDTDTSDNLQALAPQALPRITWHLAEELVPLRGAIDRDGRITFIGQ